jgi:hypothetical protein
MDLRSSGTRVFSQSIEYSNLEQRQYRFGSVAVFILPLIVKKQTQIRIISHMDKNINRLSHCKLVGGPQWLHTHQNHPGIPLQAVDVTTDCISFLTIVCKSIPTLAIRDNSMTAHLLDQLGILRQTVEVSWPPP